MAFLHCPAVMYALLSNQEEGLPMKPIVIIGAVGAGMSAASAIKRELPGQQVIVFGKEPYISYAA
jgi:hypothetical protein